MRLLAEFLGLLFRALFGVGAAKITEAAAPDPESPAPPPTGADEPPPSGSAASAGTEAYGPATAIARAMLDLGYRVYGARPGDDRHDLNLNIVGIRDTKAQMDQFSCRICVFWKTPGGEWKLIEWKATTYPGSRYLIEKLLDPKGAAILVPGQYPAYRLDTHNGKYKALCQRRASVRVYRDGDRDRQFDLVPSSVMDGWFGINIHAPVTPSSGMRTYIAQRVYNASAGCQVFQSVSDFLEFRSLCERAAELWGNSFTYTLLRDEDVQRADSALPSPPPSPDVYDSLEEWTPDIPNNPVGVRHKNLLNVKQGKNPWRFSIGTDSRGHTIFPTHAKGLRAGIYLLRVYWQTHGLRTIADILSRWAPANDTIGSLPDAAANSPRKYSHFVSQRVGIAATAPLALFHADGSIDDADQLFALVAAMAAFENHARLALPREIFDEAARLL